MPQWVIRTADGTFLRDKGGEALAEGESVVTVPRAPDARLERWDGSTIVARTAQEIADYDARVPKWEDVLDVYRRFTAAERKAIRSSLDDKVQDLRDEMLSAGQTDVNGAIFKGGLAYLSATMVPAVYATQAEWDARCLAIRGIT